MVNPRLIVSCIVASAGLIVCAATVVTQEPVVGDERAVAHHLLNGEEFELSISALIEHGQKLFAANWTEVEGVGRPLMKGTGKPLSDRSQPLTGPRAFNRISGPDANACAGCHNSPHAIAGGSGDYVTGAFVGAERFDFVTFDRTDLMPTRGSLDEAKRPATLQTVGNLRSTPGLFGAGYLEMLARQMTGDLQHIRDTIQPGRSKAPIAKGVSFGILARRSDGTWDTSGVEGLSSQSLTVSNPTGTPSLVIHPWRQSGSVASLREFTNTAFNAHLGIQTTERFGVGADPDGDGVRNEMTRGDVTAVTIFQATLPVPGRVIPNDPRIEQQVRTGERLFEEIRCTSCHVPILPLDRRGWIYSEPGPFNAPGNLQRAGARVIEVDLTDPALPSPRLMPSGPNADVVHVPAYTDFKLHDITDPSDEIWKEPLDINQPSSSPGFLQGNRKFLTRRLWGAANEPPYFHHGLFTTLREAVLAHSGEALEQRKAFQGLTAERQESLFAFLETLQVLPPVTKALVVDERHEPKKWPPIH